MTAAKAGEVDGLLRRGLNPGVAVVLVHGPDIGLVGERARHVAERAVDDPADPFQLVRLDGDAVAGDPGRLADEAGTVGLFGGRRAIWVRLGARNLVPAVEAVLAAAPGGNRVVIEAGDLGKGAPLRALCERSPRALALPCYPDEAGQVADLIERTLAASNLRIGREARGLLMASLGGDRLATRGELEKLALYAHGAGEVTPEHVEAVVADVSGLALNALVDAAFGGRTAEAERAYRRFRGEGEDAATLVGAALRHAWLLATGRAEVEAGKPAAGIVAAWRGLHFRRAKGVEAQLQRWSGEGLREVVDRLSRAMLACRRAEPGLAHALAAGVFLEVATLAARAAPARR